MTHIKGESSCHLDFRNRIFLPPAVRGWICLWWIAAFEHWAVDLLCGVEQWQLVGLITQRSAVRVRPPRPLKIECWSRSASGHYVNKSSGGQSATVPPVPIPNTEVKRCSVDDTALATVWENRSLPGGFILNAAGPTGSASLFNPVEEGSLSQSHKGAGRQNRWASQRRRSILAMSVSCGGGPHASGRG